MPNIQLSVTSWQLAVCKLDATGLPDWARDSRFVTFTRTPQELSLVCEAQCVPSSVQAELDWRCLVVDGVLGFSLVGIISGITRLLAAAQISVFVISSYDTDYLLVKQDKLEEAVAALKAGGYHITT